MRHDGIIQMAPAMPELEGRVLEAVAAAEERRDPPLLCAMELGRRVRECGMEVPCVDLGQILVSHLCFKNNTPAMWKLLDQALAFGVVVPFHVLALLTARVLPNRRMQPEAYGLYLDILDRYIFSLPSLSSTPNLDKLIKSIDSILQLSSSLGILINDIGQMIVSAFFNMISNLIACIIEDDKLPLDEIGSQIPLFLDGNHMDFERSVNDKRNARHEVLCKRNSLTAIRILDNIMMHKRSTVLLRLVQLNMPAKFDCLLQTLPFIKGQTTSSPTLIPAKHVWTKIRENVLRSEHKKFLPGSCDLIGALIHLNKLSSCHLSGVGHSASWVAFDILLENTMDGKHLFGTSAIVILTELTKTLQVVNQASWQQTFEALWLSNLRLVQRENEHMEGPIPRLDARLCALLSITPLAIASIIKEEEDTHSPKVIASRCMFSYKNCQEGSLGTPRRSSLIHSLQQLQLFTGLLSPPPSVATAANDAATKAAVYVSDFQTRNGNSNGKIHSGTSIRAKGSMLHLIVEACIARNLIDTSAYFWPGYVVSTPKPPKDTSIQETPWLAFMEGAELTGALKKSLMTVPASSLDQVEKIYHIALHGSNDERLASAMILCGASLSRGWNIQEHVVRLVVKLLSPPVPPDFTGTNSHLVASMSMLYSVLLGASEIDVVHIMSLYGMVPEVAASLMPLCETFGSMLPTSVNPEGGVKDESSIYSVFSCAFLFLLRLWKFYRPPHEHNIAGRWGTVKPELSLDYLLLMRNRHISCPSSASCKRDGVMGSAIDPPGKPVYIDSFPKLRAWYFQNQACVFSTISGVCSSNPAQEVANQILNMISQKMKKMTSGVSISSSSNSSINGSSSSSEEGTNQKPLLPAWDILEAIPIVLEALLTAYANGRLSSRELITGLRDIVDFLPASLAVIISYFSAETTRGIWKPVELNGIDWPSPSANLGSVVSEIRDILSSAGVDLPSCYAGIKVPIMLPLPMVALLSLTITFKLDKSMDYIHGVTGPGLENCATCCPWPSFPIVGALWAQKVRRWHDFIVFSCASYPFTQDRNAISQLLRSCFASFLDPSVIASGHLNCQKGVNGLLGHAFSENGSRLSIAPGFLYIRSCRGFLDSKFLVNEIIKLVIQFAHELASGWSCGGPCRLSSSKTSLTTAAVGVKEIGMLGATLLCISGGIRLVQLLYMEIAATWLLSKNDNNRPSNVPAVYILEGYTLAYFIFLSGSLIWGVGDGTPGAILTSRSRRARAVTVHMDFLAGAASGGISLGCDPLTLKAYMSCFLGLVSHCAPVWVSDVSVETLKKLAKGLRNWHENELALSLLERGGPSAMESVIELIM